MAQANTPEIYAKPMDVEDPDSCRFYHSIDLPEGEFQKGDWDLRGREADYAGQVDVAGKRVLDLGAASGFMSFAFEQQGAEVVSADVDSSARYTKVPYHTSKWGDKDTWLTDTETGLKRMKRSYWYAHGKLGSNAKCFYGNLLDLPPALGRFDVGFIGQIMVHNRDPLGLLQGVAELTDETIIVTEGMIENDNPIARVQPSMENNHRVHSWFRFSTGAIQNLLEVMGFEVTYTETKPYRNVILDRDTPITTMVGRRVSSLP